jgi:hypothetical protein
MQDESFFCYRRRAILHPGRHMHFETGVTRGTRHRQPVGKKCPVFGDDIEQPRRRLRVSAMRIWIKVRQQRALA